LLRKVSAARREGSTAVKPRGEMGEGVSSLRTLNQRPHLWRVGGEDGAYRKAGKLLFLWSRKEHFHEYRLFLKGV